MKKKKMDHRHRHRACPRGDRFIVLAKPTGRQIEAGGDANDECA